MAGAKVVTKAKTPGANCFGLVTMSALEEVNRCIERLSGTELDGKVITVEKVLYQKLFFTISQHYSRFSILIIVEFRALQNIFGPTCTESFF